MAVHPRCQPRGIKRIQPLLLVVVTTVLAKECRYDSGQHVSCTGRRHTGVPGMAMSSACAIYYKSVWAFEHNHCGCCQSERGGGLLQEGSLADWPGAEKLLHLAGMGREHSRSSMASQLLSTGLRECPECVGIEDGRLRKLCPELLHERLNRLRAADAWANSYGIGSPGPLQDLTNGIAGKCAIGATR